MLLSSDDFIRYQGEFERNLYHGYGVQQFAPYLDSNNKYVIGKRYEGDFKNGLKHGRGLLLSGTGDVYTGMFERDLFHGSKYIYFY